MNFIFQSGGDFLYFFLNVGLNHIKPFWKMIRNQIKKCHNYYNKSNGNINWVSKPFFNLLNFPIYKVKFGKIQSNFLLARKSWMLGSDWSRLKWRSTQRKVWALSEYLRQILVIFLRQIAEKKVKRSELKDPVLAPDEWLEWRHM